MIGSQQLFQFINSFHRRGLGRESGRAGSGRGAGEGGGGGGGTGERGEGVQQYPSLFHMHIIDRSL